MRNNGCVCLTHRCCFTRSCRKSKHKAIRISSCVSLCPKTAPVFFLSVSQEQMFPKRPLQRIKAKMETGRRNLWLSLLVALAPMLLSNNANANGPLVDIQSENPTILVELRYAGSNNLLKQPLYPHGTRALARPEIASALTAAQTFLRRYQYGLKIWDAYRPVAAQTRLWEASHNSD